MKKILYGICGIGNGHLFRQLPIIHYLLEQNYQILIFTYGQAYDYLKEKYFNHPLIKIQKVWVPYYIGNDIHDKVDFELTYQQKDNNNTEQFSYNLLAFSIAQQWLGKPDLVITDYEPNAAQYGYAYQVSVVTFDQQSKYLLQAFPEPLETLFYQDEVMRLNMFFPKAKRIACSFFKPLIECNTKQLCKELQEVTLIAPFMRKEIQYIKAHLNENQATHTLNPCYLVYLTAQNGFKQELTHIVDILKERKEEFHLFLSIQDIEKNKSYISSLCASNIFIHQQGSVEFFSILEKSKGIICTAGHSLLSEAMYLQKPVYALPLLLYEQALNAYVISHYEFGVSNSIVEKNSLENFINHIEVYRKNIIVDKNNILMNDNNSFEKFISIISFYLEKEK